MKKILLSSLVILALNVYATGEKNTLPRTVDTASQQKADSQLKIQNNKIVKLVVEEISKKLPQKVDAYTQFTSIKSEGLTLVSIFEINTGSKSDEAVRNEDKERMESFIIEGICQSSKRFLESNINIRYVYKSANTKNELFSFAVTEKDCSSFRK